MPTQRVVIDYTNYKGDRRRREIEPKDIFFGTNEWYPDPQWLLNAHDIEKGAERTFALAKIHSWEPA